MSALATLIEKHLTTLIKTEGQGKKKERKTERKGGKIQSKSPKQHHQQTEIKTQT